MQKLQRNYKIQFEIGHRPDNLIDFIPEEILEIKYPTTLHLNTENSPFSLTSSGSFQLYNLSPKTQNLLHKDIYDFKKYILMKLYAGYQDVMPCIFWGNISQCYSTRPSGSVDYITSFEANNMMYYYLNGFINNTYAEGTSYSNLINDILTQTVPQAQIGYITEELKPLQSNQTFLGNAFDLLRDEYPDFQIYVDNNQFNIIADNEVVPGDVQVITSRSGLLGTPIRRQTYWDVDCIFEPGLKICQAVTLISQTAQRANNTYKVAAIKHAGIISPVESGTLITRVSLYMGGAPLKELTPKTTTYGEPQTPATGNWVKPLTNYRRTSPYGYRTHPKTKEWQLHTGVDLAAPLGTPIMAARNGIVSTVGWKGGYGKTVTINHGKQDNITFTSLYGHMSNFAVSVNDKVSAGQLIGYVGSTGESTGNHLHFGIYENNKAVDPTKYIGL